MTGSLSKVQVRRFDEIIAAATGNPYARLFVVISAGPNNDKVIVWLVPPGAANPIP